MLPQTPNKPGVYLIKDRTGKIIYIGKAISISKRIRSHFKPDSKISPYIADVDYIVTSNELEALILEAVLIKKHKPRYNVLLRDDKQYPYIKLTMNESWPSILMVRKIVNDGAEYFGPYTGQTVRNIFKLVKRLFQIRWCKEFKKRGQPCFYYHMGKCLAPCAKDIDKDQYLRAVKDVELFLKGKYEAAIDKLRGEMKTASEHREYEVAAQIRDRLKLFEKISEEQKVVSADKKDRDIFYCTVYGTAALVFILEIRSGKLVGKESYFLKDMSGKDDNVLTSSLIQYYSGAAYIPEEIISNIPPGEKKLLEAALTKLRGSRVHVRAPRYGKARGLYKMAEQNAKYVLAQKLRVEGSTYDLLSDLKQALGLDKMPYRIEAFDISTTMGVESVGSMVAFEGGLPKKSDYRRFRIFWTKGMNDVAGISEVVKRRYKGSLSRQLAMPDLILIDGGIGQLNAARSSVPDSSDVIGLAKKLEEIYLPGKRIPLRLKSRSPALKLLQRIRNEAHRFAITFHRKRRTKRMLA